MVVVERDVETLAIEVSQDRLEEARDGMLAEIGREKGES
jgi:hypothetical protein